MVNCENQNGVSNAKNVMQNPHKTVLRSFLKKKLQIAKVAFTTSQKKSVAQAKFDKKTKQPLPPSQHTLKLALQHLKKKSVSHPKSSVSHSSQIAKL